MKATDCWVIGIWGGAVLHGGAVSRTFRLLFTSTRSPGVPEDLGQEQRRATGGKILAPVPQVPNKKSTEFGGNRNKWLYLRLAKMNTQQAGITGPVPSSGNGERLCILRRVLNVFLFFLQVYSQKLVSDGSATWCGVLEVISCEHLPFEMQSRTREPRGRSAPGADSNLCEVREELAWRRTSPATRVC